MGRQESSADRPAHAIPTPIHNNAPRFHSRPFAQIAKLLGPASHPVKFQTGVNQPLRFTGLGETAKESFVSAHQRLFLGNAPTFDLRFSLAGGGEGDERLLVDNG